MPFYYGSVLGLKRVAPWPDFSASTPTPAQIDAADADAALRAFSAALTYKGKAWPPAPEDSALSQQIAQREALPKGRGIDFSGKLQRVDAETLSAEQNAPQGADETETQRDNSAHLRAAWRAALQQQHADYEAQKHAQSWAGPEPSARWRATFGPRAETQSR